MDKYETDDPALLDWFTTDSDGRITLGREWGNKRLKICVVEVDEDE